MGNLESGNRDAIGLIGRMESTSVYLYDALYDLYMI
jgi:hypothetical protein